MRNVRFRGLAFACLFLLSLTIPVFAQETSCDTVYCFSAEDFTPGEEPIAGICITELPQSSAGTVMLGNRVLRAGDILTADQVAQMTFH